MSALGNDAELERLRDEADHLRIKLSLANNDHTKDHGAIGRLTSTITIVERHIAEKIKTLGPYSEQSPYRRARRIKMIGDSNAAARD